jgi:hypothetical protein
MREGFKGAILQQVVYNLVPALAIGIFQVNETIAVVVFSIGAILLTKAGESQKAK